MDSQRVWFPLVSSPFFLPTSQDTMRLATLSREAETRSLACLEASAFEQVHFARALVSLFENRKAAGASFRRVIADNPSSPLAAPRILWLQLLGNTAADDRSPLTEITAQFVRDGMERELAEHRTHGKPDALTTAQDSIEEQSRVVQVLHKQVRERDRRIAILRSQSDALKLIDQDHEDRKRTLKMPAALLPMTDTRPQ